MPLQESSAAIVQSARQLRSVRYESIVLIVLCLGLVASPAWSRNKLTAFWSAIQPHNQQYSALSFSNANNLPIALSKNGTLSFSFTIQNNEGKTLSYPYSVSVTTKTASTPDDLVRGNIRIANSDQRTIPEKISVRSLNDPTVVTVTLPQEHEAIDFILKGSAS